MKVSIIERNKAMFTFPGINVDDFYCHSKPEFKTYVDIVLKRVHSLTLYSVV